MRIIEFTESTNTELSQLLVNEQLPSGFMLLALNQLRGRGHRGNIWESSPGKNVTATMFLKPQNLAPSDQFYLTMVIALGVVDLLKKFIPGAPWSVKWPNDVYYADKKIAGILIENVILGNDFGHCLAGIGLNVNQLEFLSDAPNPISLSMITGDVYEIEAIAYQINESILQRFTLLESGRYNELRSDFLNHLYLRGVPAQYIYDNKIIQATINDIDPFGRLELITTDTGEFILAAFKEIKYLK